jgi:hypothetical protein
VLQQRVPNDLALLHLCVDGRQSGRLHPSAPSLWPHERNGDAALLRRGRRCRGAAAVAEDHYLDRDRHEPEDTGGRYWRRR